MPQSSTEFYQNEILEQFQRKLPSDDKFIREALGGLHGHLNDQFLLKDQIQETMEFGTKFLRVFQALDEKKTRLFLLVSSNGEMRLGDVDKLNFYKSTKLDGFDELWDHVVSVNVSNTRFDGDGLDVWIVVHRDRPDSDPGVYYYHGIAGIDRVRCFLEPSPERNNSRKEWQPKPLKEGQAEWLHRWNYIGPQNKNPFLSVDDDSLKTIRKEDANSHHCLEKVIHRSGELIMVIDDQIKILKEGEGPQLISFQANIECSTYWPDREHEFKFVVGCDDRTLVCYESKSQSKTFQVCREVPSSLVSLPMEGSAEPDLLVAFLDGRLYRLTPVVNDGLRILWAKLWQALGVQSIEHWLSLAKEVVGSKEAEIPWRKAVLSALMKAVTDEALWQVWFDSNDETVREENVKKLVSLFEPNELDVVMQVGLQDLLDVLTDQVRDGKKGFYGKSLSRHLSFLIRLARDIYYICSLPVQDQFDHLFRTLNLDPEKVQDENICNIVKWSKQSRSALLQRGPKDSELNSRVYTTMLYVERWADAFWEEDFVRLTHFRRNALVDSSAILEGETTYLILAQRGRLLAYPIQGEGLTMDREGGDKQTEIELLGLQPIVYEFLNTHEDVIQCLTSLTGPSPRFLVGGASGCLYLFSVSNGSFRLVPEFDFKEFGSPRCLVACKAEDGCLVAASFNMDRKAELVLLLLKDDLIHTRNKQSLKMARVRMLAVSRGEGNHFHLIKAGLAGATARFGTVDSKLRFKSQFSSHEIHSTARTVCFDRKDHPRYAIVGERNGYVWCTDLKTQPNLITDHCWSHRFKHGIRTALAVDHLGSPHFLIGTESGELALLRACDGRRIWKHKFYRQIEKLVALDETSSRVAVFMNGGWVALLKHLDDQVAAIKNLNSELEQYKGEGITYEKLRWRNAENSVQALFGLQFQLKKGAEIFRENSERVTRTRIVRYLAENYSGSFTRDVMEQLTMREAALLLSYLKPDNTDAQDEVWQAIWPRFSQKDADGKGDNSLRAEMAVVATYLQIYGIRKPELKDLVDLRVPERLLEQKEWVCVVFSRLLFEAAQRHWPDTGKDEPSLFFNLLPYLFQLSSCLLTNYVDVLPHDSKLQKIFTQFQEVFNEAISGGRAIRDLGFWETLVTQGKPIDEKNLPAMVLHYLARFFASEIKEDWNAHRSSNLKVLEDLHGLIISVVNSDQPHPISLFRYVAPLFPPDPMPLKTRRLEDRLAWFQDWKNLLNNVSERKPEGGEPDHWWPLWKSLCGEVKSVLKQFLDQETAFLAREVRPFLTLDGVVRGKHGKITLRLSSEPDGNIEAHDVTIVYSVDVPGGLIGIGKESTHRRELESYPGSLPRDIFQLAGLLREDQKTVAVKVTMIYGTMKSETLWPLELPKERLHEAGPNFLEDLPKSCQLFFKEIKRCSKSVAVLVLDESLGQQEFMRRLQTETDALRVDLDGLFAKVGEGREYSKHHLTPKFIQKSIETELKKIGFNRGNKPVIFAPMDRWVERFKLGEAQGSLTQWLGQLQERVQTAAKPNWWLLVSDDQANYLKREGLGPIPVLWAHTIVKRNIGHFRLRESLLKEELVSLVAAHLKNEEREVHEQVLDRLGWDLRYVLGWLRWRKLNDGDSLNSLQSASNYLTARRHFLKNDLSFLSGEELLVAQLGAVATSKMRVSEVTKAHVCAEEFKTTIRKRTSTSKTLQKPGEYFTDRTLIAIKSDINPSSQVTIQGIGAGTYHAPINSFYQVYRAMGKGLEGVFEKLLDQGIGTYEGKLFRTADHFRYLIQLVYKEVMGDDPETPDSDVYRKLLGSNKTPLENLNFDRLQSLATDQLELLLNGVDARARCLALQELIRAWQDSAVDSDRLRGVLKPFFPKLVLPDVEGMPYLEPLGKTEQPVFCLDVSDPPLGFMVWLNRGVDSDHDKLLERLEQSIKLWKEAEKRKSENQGVWTRDLSEKRWFPFLTITGPGVAEEFRDESRKLSFLKPLDFLRAISKNPMPERIMRRIKMQHSFLHRSPFQITNALPPNSPIFFGREKETEFIHGRVRTGSILIVGSRRVGKTSLLNQIHFWAQREPDLFPVKLDLQGIEKQEGFQRILDLQLEEMREQSLIGMDISNLANEIAGRGQILVFLLNEIDSIVKHDSNFVSSWRSLNDEKKARFVMVGYNTLNLVGDPNEHFFHFTQGTAYENKAVPLRQLEPSAARRIPQLLEIPELGLTWISDQERELALDLLLDRSYRIPWVLQTYCQKIVEKMNEDQSDVMTHKMVADLVRADRESPIVWQYIENIDFRRLSEGKGDQAFPLALKLILYSMARDRYFLGGLNAPIRDKNLNGRDALSKPFNFSTAEAFDAINRTMKIILFQDEFRAVKKYFENFELNNALRLLTLTLLLESDSFKADRYGFLLHILPLELNRHYQENDPTLDGVILKLAVDLFQYLKETPL